MVESSGINVAVPLKVAHTKHTGKLLGSNDLNIELLELAPIEWRRRFCRSEDMTYKGGDRLINLKCRF
jgi:hypothetical protein